MTSYSHNPNFDKIFNGEYSDFTPKWFDSIGTFIMTNLIINSFYPLIELLINYAILVFFMMVDQSIWNPWKLQAFPTHSKCNSVSSYYDLYAGPVY